MRGFFVVVALLGQILTTSPASASAGCDGDLTNQIDPHTGRPLLQMKNGYGYLAQQPQPQPPPPRPSLGSHFRALMNFGLLLHQMDHRLGQRKLLLPNGGLCASTCGVNIVHSMLAYLRRDESYFRRYADYYVHRIVHTIFETFGRDGRLGLLLPELAHGLHWIAMDLNLKIETHYQALNPVRGIFAQDLTLEDDELIVLSVQSGRGADGSPLFHAIVLTEVNLYRQTVKYSDPNDPNYHRHARMESIYDLNGLPSVRIDYNYPGIKADKQTGLVASFLRVRLHSR